MLKKYLIGTFAVAMFAFAATASAYDFGTTTLKVGSKGEAVKTLQTLVGATPADGIFGKMTAAKVKVWQAANGLTADGVFGNMSKAKANMTAGGSTTGSTCPTGYVATTPVAPLFASCMMATETPTTPTTPTGLTGGAGDVTFTATSAETESEIVEGAEEKVLSFRAEADGSDVALTNMKISLSNAAFDFSTGIDFSTAGTGSMRIERYIDEVSVWDGSTKVATIKGTEFTKSSNLYSKSVALNNVVVKDGSSNRKTFFVSIKALSNIDTADLTSDSWDLRVDNIRFADATGMVTTSDYSQTLANSIDFVDTSSAGDVKIKVATVSANPAAGNVSVSDTSSTSDVTMLAFSLKAEGTDMSVDSLKLTLTGTGATPAEIASEFAIYNGSTKLGDLTSHTTNNTYTVDLFDTFTINQDQTVTFTVKAKINKIAVGNFGQGDSLKVNLGSLTSLVEDVKSGNTVTSMSGSATGETQTFLSQGVNVVMGTPTVTPTTNSTTGEVTSVAYSIPVSVTAFGDTLYLGQIAQNAATATASGAFAFVFQNSGAPTITDTSVTVSGITFETSNATIESNGYRIDEGSTRNFVIRATLLAGTNNTSYRVQLKQVRAFTEAGLVTGTSTDLAPEVSFRTGFQLLNN